jgi:hypothetical protein
MCRGKATVLSDLSIGLVSDKMPGRYPSFCQDSRKGPCCPVVDGLYVDYRTHKCSIGIIGQLDP